MASTPSSCASNDNSSSFKSKTSASSNIGDDGASLSPKNSSDSVKATSNAGKRSLACLDDEEYINESTKAIRRWHGSMPSDTNLPLSGKGGLGECISWQMHMSRNITALIDGDYSITYAELNNRAHVLADRIMDYQITREEPIALMIEQGVDHVIAQIAILYAGGTCVPVDTSLPEKQLEIRLADAKTRYLITDAQNQYRFPEFERIVVPLEGVIVANQHNIAKTSLEHRTHMLYTSGTTGKPKAVQIIAKGIARLAYSWTWSPIAAGDRVAHINPVSFDASIFDMWITLLCGATIVVVKKATLLDPLAFSECLHGYGITTMFITTALFNLTALGYPRAFSGLKTLMTGGEVFSLNAMKSVFEQGPPERLFHVYGPTECSVFSTAHRITIGDVEKGVIGIGKAIGGTSTYVLSESLEPVKANEVGELFIGGDAVSRGYYNRPELTNKVFTSVSGLTSDGSPLLLYRTGDLVREDDSGTIEYICRRDNQVKIHGMRIELEAVESALMNTGLVSAAAALKVQPSEEAPSMLVAYVVLTETKNSNTADILKNLKSSLPRYMVPRIEVTDKIPLNANGKLDRKALTAKYLIQSEQSKENFAHGVSNEESTEIKLEKIWLEVLTYPVDRIKPQDDFFKLGGNSMQAATLIYRVQKAFQARLSSQALYENTTLGALAAYIDDSKAGKLEALNEKEIWLADADMSQHLVPLAGKLPDWRSPKEGKVFMTGVTGFVAGHLLAQLLALPEVKTVACLVRAEDPVSGLVRIRKNLLKYDLWNESFGSKILVLPGNLTDSDLGLGPAKFNEIASWASVIFHLGAHVSYTQPYSTHRGPNVVGTFNIMRMTVTGRPKALHYVSSIASYGPTNLVTGTERLPEDEPLLKHIDAVLYDTGYSQSQWVAEHMVQRCIDRGLPIAIYRPGFVLGHSVTGISNQDDFIGRLLNTCMTTGIYPILPRQRKEFVPVDFVVSALLHISSSLKNLYHAYNLIPPNEDNPQGNSIDLEDVFHLVNQCGSFTMRGLPYEDWCEAIARELPENGEDHPLTALMPMLHEKVYGERTRWEMYENMAIYGTDNTTRAIADSQPLLTCAPFDEQLVRTYLPTWMRG